jgi:hypothetical protein
MINRMSRQILKHIKEKKDEKKKVSSTVGDYLYGFGIVGGAVYWEFYYTNPRGGNPYRLRAEQVAIRGRLH